MYNFQKGKVIIATKSKSKDILGEFFPPLFQKYMYVYECVCVHARARARVCVNVRVCMCVCV